MGLPAAIEVDVDPPEFNIVQADPIRSGDWDAKVRDLPGASVFHTSGWARVLHLTYGFKPSYFVIRSEDGASVAAMPLMEAGSWLTGLKGVALPFTDLCPPLGAAEHVLALVNEARGLGQTHRWKYMEWRGGPEGLFFEPPSICYQAHVLSLEPSESELFDGIKSTIRTAIRKSENSAVQVSIQTDMPAVHAYYGLHLLTRRKHGVPPQPIKFFENLQRELLAGGSGFVCVARKQGAPIAAAIFVHSFGNAVYKFGASDERYQELRASNLVMWAGIRQCRSLGCRSLHFGRTPEANEGLRRFKTSFGAVEQPLPYFRLNLLRGTVDKVKDGSEGPLNSVFRKCPRWVSRKLGELLYPHAT